MYRHRQLNKLYNYDSRWMNIALAQLIRNLAIITSMWPKIVIFGHLEIYRLYNKACMDYDVEIRWCAVIYAASRFFLEVD